MPLENASLIHELIDTNPDGSDQGKFADDHLRMIKKAVLGTFPNLTGAVTSTAEELNQVTLENLVPTGLISMWSGTNATIPSGWALCDGLNGTPDLTDRFILGSSDDTRGAVGDSHTATTSTDGSHNHGGTEGHALIEAEMPSHTHGLRLMTSSTDGGEYSSSGVQGDVNSLVGYNMNANNYATPTGGNQTHSHGIALDGEHSHTVDTRGKHYKLAFIIKL
jgi:microcystin-dependent protein